MFSGCKPKYTANGKLNTEFFSFPYFVGLSFSSQNIDDIMGRRHQLGIGDNMIREPPAVEITEHGKICPWQRTWMEPLLELRNCNINVKISTEEGRYGNGEKYTKSGYSFKEKFLNFARFADHDENMRRDSFDAALFLPKGERAVSIMDWERRIFLQVAKTNNLTIRYIQDGETPGTQLEAPEWYRRYPEAEAEAIRVFEAQQAAKAAKAVAAK